MKTFYVRPRCETGYGQGDGSSYEHAWNGIEAVDWQALAREPAQLWVCGDPQGCTSGFMTVFVEKSYLASEAPHPLPRRESPQPV